MNKLEEYFVAVWCLVMPITSLLVVPSIQGTLPAYLFAFLSLAFFFLKLKLHGLNATNSRYLSVLFLSALLWLALLVGSQFGHIIDNRKSFGGAYLINDLDTSILFRAALFTQSLYLAACILIFAYFRFYFRDEWMKYVFLGGLIMATYGVYEWVYFFIFKQPGDFVANRMFGEHPGSWSQTVDFGGMSFLRIKSFYGEPSFYSPAIILYLMPAIRSKRVLLIGLLVFNAVMTASTTCYIGLIACLLFQIILSPKGRLAGFVFLVFMIGCIIALSHFFPDTFREMFGDKISGENESGRMRMESSQNTRELFAGFSPLNWIFGIGFGYSYNLVSNAILANTGLIGFAVFCFTFLKPVFCLPRTGVYGTYKTSIFGLFFLFNLTLSEFFLPTSWMFLGLAYNKLDEYERRRVDCFGEKAIYQVA